MPKVSIILPNYNYANFLDERIQSLLRQTYKDFELIILDDASTDNSREIIRKYIKEPEVQTVFYEKNSNLPYKRWNDGAELAKGEYLIFAGADDSCHPTLLEKLVATLDKHPDCGFAFAQSWEINSCGEKIRTLDYLTDNLDRNRWTHDFVNHGIDECRYLLFQNTIPNASAVLIRKSHFLRAGKFDATLILLADWLLWIKILLYADIAYIAEPLNYFRTHEGTVRNNNIRNAVSIEEKYIIFSYVMHNMPVTKEIIERFCEMQMLGWINRIVSRKCHIPWQRNRNIYAIARSVDPHFHARLIRTTGIILHQRLRSLFGSALCY